jgi:hypothetical protein
MTDCLFASRYVHAASDPVSMSMTRRFNAQYPAFSPFTSKDLKSIKEGGSVL